LLGSESQALLEFFGVYGESLETPFDTTRWRRKTGRVPKKIRYLISKFKLSARFLLDQYSAKAVPDYVVVSRQRSPEDCREWERLHPDVPCPPLGVKKYFRYLPNFEFVAQQFAKYPDMTPIDLRDLGGPEYAGLTTALLKYLRAQKL
jgi:hypothetical protein